MPFDQTNFVEAKPEVELEPWTIGAFMRWLEGRDPDETYNHRSISDCLLCRYGRDNGIVAAKPDFQWRESMKPWREVGLDWKVQSIAYGCDEIAPQIHKIGAALQRARELLDEAH